MESLTEAAVSLLRDLIRQACVNTGAPESGGEVRNVRVLQRFFAETPVEMHAVEAAPGRTTLIVRVPGTNPEAPKLGLVAHTDVVPADQAAWQRDPFGGEFVNGEVWGRGAVDMLYLTAAFAVVTRAHAKATKDQRVPGDLVFLAVADEEAGSRYGLEWVLREHPELVGVTEVISETGGMRFGDHVGIDVAEKGSAGRRILMRGVQGHGSIPYGAHNAALLAGEVLARLNTVEPAVQLGPLWDAFLHARVPDEQLRERMRDPLRLDSALTELGGIAGYAHAISRTTLSPTVVRAGHAHNVIPGVASIDLDVRTLPGTTDSDVDELLRQMLGDYTDRVEVQHLHGWAATESPIAHPLYAAIERAITAECGAPVVPIMAAGGSDARLFRKAGIPAYGFGLLSADWSYERYRERIHAANERIDIESVRLTLGALTRLVHDRLSSHPTTAMGE